MKTTIVAEPGCTHEGKLAALLLMIEMAADAGCTAFKSQWMSDPGEVCRRRNAPDYRPFYEWLSYPIAWHEQMAATCAARGLDYACTVYLPQDVATIEPFTSFYKLSAFEATSHDLRDKIVKRMTKNTKRLVISLGLGAQKDVVFVDKSLAKRVTFLRCISAYPTPMNEMNLATLTTGLHGLSDHTAASDPDSLNVGALAVASGATWIERHVRLESCDPKNPDFAVSLGGHQLTEYVRRIRHAETVRGTAKTTGPERSERKMLQHKAR